MKGIFLAFVCALALTAAEDREPIPLNHHGCPIDILIHYFLPHKYCDRYYICAAGTPILIVCPEYTLYNHEAKICDHADRVDCGDRIHPVPVDPVPQPEPEPEEIQTEKPLFGYDDPSQAPAICAKPGSNDILISHEDCRKYYQCWNGRPIAMSCQSNLFYNPKIGGCDWQANVDCKLPEEDDSHLSYPERLCNKGSFLVPNAKYCNWFYKCGPKGPSPMECQPGTVFDKEFQTCNWPIFVNCGDKIIKPAEESEEEEIIEPPVEEIDPIVPEPPVEEIDPVKPEVPEPPVEEIDPVKPEVPEPEESQPEPEENQPEPEEEQPAPEENLPEPEEEHPAPEEDQPAPEESQPEPEGEDEETRQ